MEQWSDGVFLLGQFNFFKTGCWLLVNGRKGAIVEMPPYSRHEESPAYLAWRAAEALSIKIQYIFCTHNHMDHLSQRTLHEFLSVFPKARVILQYGFRYSVDYHENISLFKRSKKLTLDNEPLYVVHAPKHSWTDTMIIFRGSIITGDWELNTIRSVHDRKGRDSVPRRMKRQSIDRLISFSLQNDYYIHSVFSVHANDKRKNVDFIELMLDTKSNRKIW